MLVYGVVSTCAPYRRLCAKCRINQPTTTCRCIMARAVCTLTTLLIISAVSPLFGMESVEGIDSFRPACCSPRKRTRYDVPNQPYSPSSPRVERLLMALAIHGMPLPRRDGSSTPGTGGSPTCSSSASSGNRHSNESLDVADEVSPTVGTQLSPTPMRQISLRPSSILWGFLAESSSRNNNIPCKKGRSPRECASMCDNCHESPCGLLEDGCTWHCRKGYDQSMCLSFCDRRPDSPVEIIDRDDF